MFGVSLATFQIIFTRLALWRLTPQLELVAASSCLAKLEVASVERLGRRLDCRVPGSWREIVPLVLAEHFAWKLHLNPDESGFWNWYGVSIESPQTLAVSAGFNGVPQHGVVEIGFSVVPEMRGRGLATQAVQNLCDWAFESAEVRRVEARVAAHNKISRRVLEKCEFAPQHEYSDEKGVSWWLYTLE